MMRINLEDINPNFGERISSIVVGLKVVVVELVCSIYFCSQWGQEMMVDAGLKMGYPKFPWVINAYHPFPPIKKSQNSIGGQELLNHSWICSTWISQLKNPHMCSPFYFFSEVLRSEVEMWRSSC